MLFPLSGQISIPLGKHWLVFIAVLVQSVNHWLQKVLRLGSLIFLQNSQFQEESDTGIISQGF